MKQIIRIFGVLGLLLAFCLTTDAQKINVPKKIETQTINRANRKTDQAINKGLDAVEKGVKDAVTSKDEPKKEEPKKETSTTNKNESATAKSGNTAEQSKPADETPTLASYSKYDFVPGDKVILFEDFSQDAVGDFPALWTTDVAGEINKVNIAPGNWFNLNSKEGTYWFMNDIDFPKNFILEMDIIPKKDGGRFAADIVFFGENSHSEMDKAVDPGIYGLHVSVEKNIWETTGYKKGAQEKLKGSSTNNLIEPEKVNHVIVWVQNRRVRIYHKGGKILDIPTNIYDGTKFSRLCFKLYRGASSGSYISNIKITNAAPDTRNKLLTEGKLVTYGIYFDVNKDVVKPESYGTLNDIATILNEVPDVKVKIVGHTDADGDAAKNLDLSKRRAIAVKNELVKTFGIDASRLETDGKGKTEPVASNDTPANKAQNRRVELIKL